IVGYEFGRNFFNFSDKILFPFRLNTDDKNGGFAEAFAALMYQYAFDEIMDDPEERLMNETLLNLKWARTWTRGYINDTTANPYNCFAKWGLDGVLDPNRGRGSHDFTAYFSTTALFPIFDIFGKDRMFPGFFKNIREQPSVVTIEDALSNIAYAASKTIQTNLNAFFINVLKFKLNQTTINQINQYPSAPSRLITDEPLLYFFSPFDSITLNLRSTNYLADNCKYLLMRGNDTISYSNNGNNYLPYSILKKRHSIQLQCYLVNSVGVKIDSFSTEIRKRDQINLIDKAADMYAYYLSNETTKSYFKDSVLVIEGLAKDKKTINRGLVYWSTVARRDRVVKLEGKMKSVFAPRDSTYPPIDGISSNGWVFLRYNSPVKGNGTKKVGYELGVGDTTNYFYQFMIDSTSSYLPPPEEKRKYTLVYVHFDMHGYSASGYFKDVILSDLTDTDLDGILDFDDLCPTISNHPTLPQVADTTICLNTTPFSIKALATPGYKLLWYPSNSMEAESDTIPPVVNPNKVGQITYYVSQLNTQNGCEGQMAKITVAVGGLPASPSVDSLLLCKDGKSDPLTATATSGNKLLWYGMSETGGNSSQTAPTPSTSAVGTVKYYVSQQSTTTGCESGRAALTVVIRDLPSSPSVDSLLLCKDGKSDPLAATATSGNRLLWYGTSETGGSSSQTAPTPSTSVVGTTKYYVSQQNTTTGCESGRATLNVIVNSIPAIPVINRDPQGFLNINGIKAIWFKEGKATGDTSEKIKPLENGYYTASAIQNGCISSQSETFYYIITSLLNSDNRTNFTIRPNPFSQEIIIEFSFPLISNCYLSIFDNNGRSIISNKKITSGQSIQTSFIVPGNYVLQLKDLKGNILATKPIVKN
ncbi:MAG: hypothetical protein RL348_1581, partial [Bacteroidota bacterium]